MLLLQSVRSSIQRLHTKKFEMVNVVCFCVECKAGLILANAELRTRNAKQKVQ